MAPRVPQRRSEAQISGIMRQVKSENTAPEVAFRKKLWARGLRFTLHASKLPGRPDIVLPASRVVIFVDGDYWHGAQWRRRGLCALEDQFQDTPRREYWLRKIRRNMERDCRTSAELTRLGWKVLRFWESDITRHTDKCVEHAVASATRTKRLPDAHVAEKTVAEFFAGIGLMRMGLERQGWTMSFANDIDIKKQQLYEAHYRDSPSHLLLGDIHQIPAKQVPTVTLATASFPCTDLSLAGGRSGLTGKHSSAFWGFVRILDELGARRPPLILVENVPGFMTSRRGKDFEAACLALNALGYSLDPLLLDAAHFVPQSRLRLFLVGALGDHREPAIPETDEDPLRPASLARFIKEHPGIRWRLRRLPVPPQTANALASIVEPLAEDAPEWWSGDRAQRLLEQMSERHRAAAETLIAGRQTSYATVFRRVREGRTMAELRTDGVAGCLRTPRGGSARQILVAAGDGRFRVRLLTPRECARLMGADEFTLSGRPNQALFGFGDAVCVPAIEWLAQYYLNPLVTEMIHVRLGVKSSSRTTQ